MNEKQQQTSQKPHGRFSQAKNHRWTNLLSQTKRKSNASIKKMEVLLVLPLYLIWFFIWWRFRHVIKAMADVENILNNDDFFGDTNDTPKKYLKKEIVSVSAFSLASAIIKWIQEKVCKASDEIINKTYAESPIKK